VCLNKKIKHVLVKKGLEICSLNISVRMVDVS